MTNFERTKQPIAVFENAGRIAFGMQIPIGNNPYPKTDKNGVAEPSNLAWDRGYKAAEEEAFLKEHPAPVAKFGARGMDRLCAIEHTGVGWPAKSRSVAPGRIPERRREQVVEIKRPRQRSRLARVEQCLEHILFTLIVDELHRRGDMLCLDHAPRDAAPAAGFR